MRLPKAAVNSRPINWGYPVYKGSRCNSVVRVSRATNVRMRKLNTHCISHPTVQLSPTAPAITLPKLSWPSILNIVAPRHFSSPSHNNFSKKLFGERLKLQDQKKEASLARSLNLKAAIKKETEVKVIKTLKAQKKIALQFSKPGGTRTACMVRNFTTSNDWLPAGSVQNSTDFEINRAVSKESRKPLPPCAPKNYKLAWTGLFLQLQALQRTVQEIGRQQPHQLPAVLAKIAVVEYKMEALKAQQNSFAVQRRLPSFTKKCLTGK